MLKRNAQTGFTIIEVVLVLAIAGLIFLAVFIALPQLQRSQRDSTRKSDAGRLVAAINQYASNEGGSVPPADNTLVNSAVIGAGYIDDFAVYGSVNVGVFPRTASSAADDEVQYTRGVDCDGNATNNRSFVVIIGQENGVAYCAEG